MSNGSAINRRMFLAGSSAAIGSSMVLPGLAAAAPGAMVSSAPAYGPLPGVAKLNANENPYGPSPAALKAMDAAMRKGAYYVNDSVTRLKAMIAERHGLTSEHILLSSGSSGGLTYLAQAVSGSGKILGPDLFWDTTSRMGTRQQGEIKRLPKASDLAINLAAMEDAISDDVAMVQITNPNNPTGMVLAPDELVMFTKRASKKTLVLLDEAYNELTDDPEANSMVPLVKQGYNVVVARTFSKIYGLAGMRVGYLIAAPETIEMISQYALGDYSLNQAGVAAAVASYDDEPFLAYAKAKVVEARGLISEGLAANGLSALPSSTNFMFVDLGKRSAEDFRAAMAQRNVLIRGIYRDYTQWSRVSMGEIKDVQQYVAALPSALDEIPEVAV
ncbi:MAG: aminotransferase class I/II-fold pyridoxal phosphate-dependent enzyme [Pseudomonadaceae bacterium]|nr:aminotransferase class I/II-fold pyridoxal phosphate-dependent enzyme [Pseudomonadaceae bacterium]